MEIGGTGGFHVYRGPSRTSPDKDVGEMNMKLHPINSSDKSDSQKGSDNECTVREQDRFMPIANVIRIMRKVLPRHAKISDDAKETMQECVSEFISFITSEANERCQREQRKTITAEDVLWAMSKLGFDDYIEPLTLYLNRQRESEGDRGWIRPAQPAVKGVAPDVGTSSSMATFAPVFQLGHPHGLMGGFLMNAPNTASSQAAVATIDPSVHYFNK
ncbi:nuclear transcription factor Y subunit B-1-like [Diospyros lotus]|uniref:nuclear transcription factor Y subunit B-1-like n=1 Tax=Diospyros lotus TaxID=55363 RepID=UPI00225172C7|nr:nuclear transcription factor Y subunit B-1-like [Diospyros lotus]